MKKLIKVVFLSVITLFVLEITLTSQVHADTANNNVFISKAGGTAEEDFPGLEGNPLGIASVFHIFAMQASLSAHTAGNLAVENLDGKVNFGTSIREGTLAKDVSYIQNITSIQNSSFVQSQGSRTNKIILGKNINVTYTDNGNHLAFNGIKMDHVKESEVYQDQGNEKYIDFEKEFEKLNVNSNNLAQASTIYTFKNSDFSDENNRVIDVSKMSPNEDNKIIINLSSDILERDRPLIINGLSQEANAPTIVFNVDGDGSNYNVASQIKLRYDDGTERHNKETEDFSDAHVLWNFENTKNGQIININSPFQGSILAPNAELNVNQNVDGNLVAKIVNIKSESHRWDLQNTTTSTTEEPSTSTTTSTTEEPSTSTTTSTTEEPSTSTTTSTTEEPSTSTTTSTTEEPSTSTTTSTTEEPSTSTTTSTTEEPSTSTTTSTTEEPSTSTTTSTTEEPSTSTTTSTTEEPSTSTTTSTTEEPSTSTTTSTTEEPSTSTTTTGITEVPSTSTTSTTGKSSASTTTASTTEKPSTSTTTDTISNGFQKATLVSSSNQTSSDKKSNGAGNKNKSLPQTGEMSNKTASIVGIAFLIGAVISLVILRKSNRTKD